MKKVEIVASGNELLSGTVLDSNSNWICKKITGIGGHVVRSVLVRDNIDAISSEIKSAVDRKTDIIFTVGGLGPTADDMTLEAVSVATKQKLQLNTKALELIKAKYRELFKKGHVNDPSLIPSRKKMAILPAKAIPLENPVGTAPGVLLNVENSTIISLPGVPEEMKGIFEGSLQPFLKEKFGEASHIEKAVFVDSDESTLAPILKKVCEKNPRIYIKSRPKGFGPDKFIQVSLSIVGNSKVAINDKINKAVDDLKSALSTARLSIKSIKE